MRIACARVIEPHPVRRVRPVREIRRGLRALGQPDMHDPRSVHARSRPYGRVAIALEPGHQCQPSALCARASLMPHSRRRSGGSG